MPIIKYEILIKAPIDICFDLARDVDVHTQTTSNTNEKAIGGITSGLVKLGDTVTWEAKHLGIKQKLTVKIVEMEKPHRFTDIMVKGAFHSFQHTHEFIETDEGTVMKDIFKYKSPLGLFGALADRLFLENYMERFIINRATELKKIAESIGGLENSK